MKQNNHGPDTHSLDHGEFVGEPHRHERRRFVVIENPTAGPGRRRRITAVIAALRTRACLVEHLRTQKPGDATRFARQAAAGSQDAVVVAGGDGTINEVLNGIDLERTVLGVIPAGTANVLAIELGLPWAPDALAQILMASPVKRVHHGIVDGRRFAMMAGVGLDARAVAGVSPALKDLTGKLAYGASILRVIARAPAAGLRVRIAGETLPASWVVAAKGRHYAGAFVIAPRARLVRPTFEVCICPGGGPYHAVRYLGALGLGTVAGLSDVRIVEATTLHVEGPAGEPVQADGEIVARLPATIAIAPTTLNLIAP